VATRRDCFQALAQAVRDRLLQRWVQTARTYRDRAAVPSATCRPSS
jgi:Holliday junction resolvase-like predicted endonuclease